MSTGRPHHYGHLLQVQKESLQPLTLYTSFDDLITVYRPRSGADNPRGSKFLCQQKPLVTSVIFYMFQINLFEVWFYTIFFMILYMYIAPGQGLTTPWDEILMSTGTPCHFGHFLQVSKKSLWSLILYNFFHDLIHVYSPGRGRQPPGCKSLMSTERPYHFTHLLLQRNLFLVWFNTIFFHDIIHIYSTGAGGIQP